jgi:hypothetical protein
VKSFGGYTLFSPVRGRHADLLDPEGRIVHQWHHSEGMQHVKLLANGRILAHSLPPAAAEGAEDIGGSAGALFELDRDNRVVWEYRDLYMHHDFLRLDNGNTLVICWAKIPPEIAARVQGGHVAAGDPDWMWGDVIREIDPAGTVVREWKSWEHLSTDHHVKCPLESRKEWTHLNSVELTPDGDWLLSFRLTSTVVIVDATTGDVRWRWGPEVLSHQHHATWLDNGHILVFDNGCHRKEMPSFSQIVEVDPDTRKVVWSYQGVPILAFYSFMISGCERLPNGNTLITEGATGRIFEITRERETVWEYVSPWILPSRFGPTSAVFRAYRIANDDPSLKALTFDHNRYSTLNRRIAANKTLGEADDKRKPRRPSTRATQQTANN